MKSHKIKYRVYYEDTDAGGIVYYPNYLKFAERARTEWLREIGFNQSEMEHLFVVRKASIDYLQSAKLDDEILIETSLQNIGGASITMKQEFYRDETKLAEAEILLVHVDRNIKPVKISEEIREKIL